MREERWAVFSCVAIGALTCVLAGFTMDLLGSIGLDIASGVHIAIAVGCGFAGMLAWAWHLDRVHDRIESDREHFVKTQRKRAHLQ
jgi:hypothetical protein